jgi:hypothetical protein
VAFNLRSRIAWSWIGIAVMSPFNVLALGIGLVLTCFGNTTVRAELQIDEAFDKSELWTIVYNDAGDGGEEKDARYY